jgi:hypothetical protein
MADPESFNFPTNEMALWILFLLGISVIIEVGTITPSESGHWQGDIVLTPRQKIILDGAARTSNTATTDLALRWPKVGGYVWVPYKIDADPVYSEFF